MKVLLVLAGLAACYFVVRWLRRRFAETSRRKAVGQRALESRAERDRRDCLALEMALKDGPDQQSPDAVAQPDPRRRATVRPSGFDPDLPAPVKDSATRV